MEHCKYSEVSYEEYDTGYKEFSCILCDGDCGSFPCPLDFKYKVEE